MFFFEENLIVHSKMVTNLFQYTMEEVNAKKKMNENQIEINGFPEMNLG